MVAAEEKAGESFLSNHNKIGIKTDGSGARYVTEIQTEQTKNYQGGSKQKDLAYSDVRMYENSTPLDPVGSFEVSVNFVMTLLPA